MTESETVTEFTRSRRSSRTPDPGLRTPDPRFRAGSDTDTVAATATDTGSTEPVKGVPTVPFSWGCERQKPTECPEGRVVQRSARFHPPPQRPIRDIMSTRLWDGVVGRGMGSWWWAKVRPRIGQTRVDIISGGYPEELPAPFDREGLPASFDCEELPASFDRAGPSSLPHHCSLRHHSVLRGGFDSADEVYLRWIPPG